MEGCSDSLTSNSSTQEALQAFLNFCRRRSKKTMGPNTLDRYEQAVGVLFRTYGPRLDSVDALDLKRIVTERAQVLAPATFNTEMAVLRRRREFHHLESPLRLSPTDFGNVFVLFY